MKHLKSFCWALFLVVFSWPVNAQVQQATVTTDPASFGVNDEITVTVSGVDPAIWGVSDIYFWGWHFNGAGNFAGDALTNGTWENSNEAQRMTDNGDGTFSFTFVPSALYGSTDISQIGMLAKAKNGSDTGSGEKKTQDTLIDVGGFKLELTSPTERTQLVDAGTLITVEATTNGEATFTLYAEETIIDQTTTPSTTYSFSFQATATQTYTLEANDGTQTVEQSFNLIIRPDVVEEALPAGVDDGINRVEGDPTKAVLVLFAPGKEFVHVIGDFNNWEISDDYVMKKDPAQDRFWIELTGLTPGADHLYQYLVETTINIADPYSTLIIDGFGNDDFIEAEVFPNIPAYPAGQSKAITVLRTQEEEYQWEVTDFEKPKREDLVIYELLIRDFDERHSFDAVVDRLDYLEGLGVNAIEFMPLNEFDGNESWGYNPSFHMALDKYYGTKNAFKRLVDECHKRGIAVLLDVVYNHGTGQNPFYQLWNTDDGGTGGTASTDSPFFNPSPRHSYSVFNDFNHSSQATRDYVIQTAQYWIEEFKIDGYRWDLTKGFTQNCTANDEGCTNSTQPDRIEVLKLYADAQWEIDPDFFVIFEHLGNLQEEEQWADYRIEEGKGIMLWNKQTDPYNEATMGYHVNNQSNFRFDFWRDKGFKQPSVISYMESHDEQRLMYKNLEFGNSSGDYNVKDLPTALARMQTAGAFFFSIPGPKMLWQFGELGYEVDINDPCRVCNKPIRWEYADDPDRIAIYNIWKKLIKLKIEEPIFETSQVTLELGSPDGFKYIGMENPGAGEGEISFLAVLGNFGVEPVSIDSETIRPGDWYELLNNNRIVNIEEAGESLTLQPGEFILVADAPSQVLIDPNDLDGDGVPNDNDQCPNTEPGATVGADGCVVFSLPASNFEIQTRGSSCPGSENGQIFLSANQSLSYTVTLSNGSNVDLSDSFTGTAWSTDSLAPGNYTLCLGVEGQAEYEVCYQLVLTEPEPLNVSARLDSEVGKLTLNLSGSDQYTLTHNGKTLITTDSVYELRLEKGVNQITVRGKTECQGAFSAEYLILDKIRAWPNPTQESIQLMGNYPDGALQVRGYDMTGQLIYTQEVQTQPGGVIQLDLSGLRTGVYLLEVGNEKVRVLKK